MHPLHGGTLIPSLEAQPPPPRRHIHTSHEALSPSAHRRLHAGSIYLLDLPIGRTASPRKRRAAAPGWMSATRSSTRCTTTPFCRTCASAATRCCAAAYTPACSSARRALLFRLRGATRPTGPSATASARGATRAARRGSDARHAARRAAGLPGAPASNRASAARSCAHTAFALRLTANAGERRSGGRSPARARRRAYRRGRRAGGAQPQAGRARGARRRTQRHDREVGSYKPKQRLT